MRFVSTSSVVAVLQPGDRLNERTDVTPDTWNEASVKAAWAPPPYEPERSGATYAASKVQAEKAVYKFVEDRKPHFVANTVLTALVAGLPVNIEKQGYPSSLALLRAFWTGDALWQWAKPMYMVRAKNVFLGILDEC